MGSLISVLAFLLSDDGIGERQNRENLLNPFYEQIGIGAFENENDVYLTIILVENF